MRHALLLLGFDELDLPLQLAELLIFAAVSRHNGWIDGYRADHRAGQSWTGETKTGFLRRTGQA